MKYQMTAILGEWFIRRVDDRFAIPQYTYLARYENGQALWTSPFNMRHGMSYETASRIYQELQNEQNRAE